MSEIVRFYSASVRKKKLDPRVQQIITENAAVNELQSRLDYHNTFTFRYNPRLRLVPMEEEGQK